MSEVNISEHEGVRYLHFGTPWVQGAMRMATPDALHLQYIRRMMAWLLLTEPDAVAGGHAMQLGLGAGAITKFCLRGLNMRGTVIEINPRVVMACRSWFDLPDEDPQLQLVLADAREEIRNPLWQGTVDALAVDMYDEDAAGSILNTAEDYAQCRRLLTPGGCMVVNLFGHRASFKVNRDRIVGAFGAEAVWVFKPTKEGNTIVLAQRNASGTTARQLRRRAQYITENLGLNASAWLDVLKPLTP